MLPIMSINQIKIRCPFVCLIYILHISFLSKHNRFACLIRIHISFHGTVINADTDQGDLVSLMWHHNSITNYLYICAVLTVNVSHWKKDTVTLMITAYFSCKISTPWKWVFKDFVHELLILEVDFTILVNIWNWYFAEDYFISEVIYWF